ncbi:hypothetical protein B0A54_16821 [Friedmanniomyces endolithicus]|uniref:GID complex catalytic subunit 2 n=1 Tax=Friedmanniomyces endolithicus TaxID=329885 RepID=A0A4U0U0B8_9PEZI|nr:hypothetical protein LTS09_015113 [Friedmanniomyces endolithicus]TKA27505.1 hypothetical protein B0A54_16821 [Friedmanniomyces endolithicus]
MDALLTAHNTLTTHANLSTTLTTVDHLIDLLQQTRDTIANQPSPSTISAPLQIAKLKGPIRQTFEKVEEDLKEVNKGLNGYQKAWKEKFKGKDGVGMESSGESLGGGGGGGGGGVGLGLGAGSGVASGGLAGQKGLVERAIAMHLLREGKFHVASTFVKEVSAQSRSRNPDDIEEDHSWLDDFTTDSDNVDMDDEQPEDDYEDGELYGPEVIERGYLQRKFAEMYRILDALRNHHNLAPAIHWANNHSDELGARASNLEFELARLRFVELYTSSKDDPKNMDDPDPSFSGPIAALHYARTVFPYFHPRYTREISALLGALAFSPSLPTSPYHTLFSQQTSWETVATLFTTSFTTLLDLPSSPPLLTTTNAGVLALPILTKFTQILSRTRSSWTTSHELPVETPLPGNMVFHNIFVCPVSKEQGTEANWPVMLPCGHVLARESLEAHARGKGRCKCPYCPVEFRVEGGGKRVFI